MTAVLAGAAYYDGRATAEENFHERTGLATAVAPAVLRAPTESAVAGVRYVEAICGPDGALRLFYVAPRPDGAHELRTQRTQRGQTPLTRALVKGVRPL